MTLAISFKRGLQGLIRWPARLVPAGVVAGVLVAGAQTIAGCAGNMFPLTGATFFQVRQIAGGTLAFSTPATASEVTADFTAAITMPRLAIQNLTGPPIFVEGVLLFGDNLDASPSSAIPVKQQIAGSTAPASQRGPSSDDQITNNLVINISDDLGFASALRTTPLGPKGTMPASRFQSFFAVLLWKNALGQDNFRPGVFDPVCFCYTTLPTLKTAGVEIISASNRAMVSYSVSFTVGSGSGGGAGGGG